MYKLYDLENDASTLIQVMSVHPDYKEWFESVFPEGAPTPVAVTTALKKEVNPHELYEYSDDCEKLEIFGDILLDDKFVCQHSLKTVLMSEGVTFVGDYNFANCANLQSIHLPDSLKLIGNYAFSENISLTSVHIPHNVSSIGWYAFRNCPNLTTVELPDKLTSIDIGAFSGCPNVVITYKNNLYDHKHLHELCARVNGTIRGNQFSLRVLERLTDRLTMVKAKYPDYVDWFKAVYPYGAPSYDYVEDSLNINDFEYELSRNAAFIKKYIGKTSEVVIPGMLEGMPVRYIENEAFANCEYLKKVYFPSGLCEIGERAFCNCKNLEHIDVPNITGVGANAFDGCERVVIWYKDIVADSTCLDKFYEYVNNRR